MESVHPEHDAKRIKRQREMKLELASLCRVEVYNKTFEVFSFVPLFLRTSRELLQSAINGQIVQSD